MPAAAAGQDIRPERATWRLEPIWAAMDRVYLVCGYLAAFSMFCIFAITMLQIAGRLFTINLRGLTDYAGYFMAASAFLAFPHALNRGAHVRIELFLTMLGSRRAWGERLAFVLATIIAAWFAYHSWVMIKWSYVLGDISQGLDATPIWIPQLSMAVGASLMAVAVADHGLRLALTGHDGIAKENEAV